MHARVSQETLAWVFPRVHARVLEKSLNGSRRRVISTRGQSRIFASSECFRHLPKEVPFTSVPIIIAMFSGIIEGCGRVVALENHRDNLDITLSCPFASELKIDQSIAHNGVCLTVVAQSGDTYTVTAIRETLDRSNLGKLQIGDEVNLERSMLLGGRAYCTGTCGHDCPMYLSRRGEWELALSLRASDRQGTCQAWLHHRRERLGSCQWCERHGV